MRVRNADRLVGRLRQLPVDMRRPIGAALLRAVVDMDAHVKGQMQGGGSGRIYRRRTVTHQASAPGEYPKTDRGQLVSSLFFRVAADRLSAVFGSALDYARYLEYGTSRMAARPWLWPTLRLKRGNISVWVRTAVQETLRKAASRG